jgi:hypothetical protein
MWPFRSRKPNRALDLEQALDELRTATDYEKWDPLLDTVSENLKTRLDGLCVIAAAGRDYPETGLGGSINSRLLQSFWGFHDAAFIPAFEAIYDTVADKSEAQETIIRALAEMGTAEAMQAILRLLARPTSENISLNTPLAVPLRETPRFGLALFPGLLAILPNLKYPAPGYEIVLSYVKAGHLQLQGFPDFRDQAIARAQHFVNQETQRNGPRADEAEWFQRAHQAGEFYALLRLLPLMDGSSIDQLLQTVLEAPELFPDQSDGGLILQGGTILKLVAMEGILHRGGRVDPLWMEGIAATPRFRWRLWHHLESTRRLDLFPLRYRTQENLAEAEMVQWLEYPTEYANAPEEIVLFAVAHFQLSGPSRESAYFFRFRHSEHSDGRWEVGMAGPYSVSGPPRLGGPKTFSRFGSWDTKSAREHINDYLPDDASMVEVVSL